MAESYHIRLDKEYHVFSAAHFITFGDNICERLHGHNYHVEVTVKREGGQEGHGWGGKFEKVVDDNFINVVDHKNLNEDIEGLKGKNPTVENITSFAWEQLKGRFDGAELESITIWETDRAYCTYKG